MHDVQRRLAALGFSAGADESGEFGEGTCAAVRAFQERRGLRIDGVCGEQTWHALVEAGWRLGDRPLYLTQPALRGDDVAHLQRQLGALGFDADRVDGIFGLRTERALIEFQRNAGLVCDSICGPATVVALARLGDSSSVSPVGAVRERERLRRGPRSLEGRRIAIGDTGGLDAPARAFAAALTVAGGRPLLLQHPDGSALAAMANAAEVDAYVGLAVVAGGDGDPASCSTAYFRSPSTGDESPEGRRLAELVQATLPAVLDATDGGVRAMSLPVLRETRMPAVVAELGAAAVVVERSAVLASALTAALRQWVAPAPADLDA